MQKLLDALNENDETQVDIEACELFFTDTGALNWKVMREFKLFAGCDIVPLKTDLLGWLIGGIKYNGKIYPFGG